MITDWSASHRRVAPAFFPSGRRDGSTRRRGRLKPTKEKPVERETAFTVNEANTKARPPSRVEYLQRQIEGLPKEAADLRKAGRLEEAQQHEEKAKYRRGQLKTLLMQESTRSVDDPALGSTGSDKRPN